MAQRAVDQQMYPQIERALDYQWGHWSDLTWWFERWPAMDAVEKEVFEVEWSGITEYRLAELGRWSEEGLLTPQQSTRYGELTQLVNDRRPALLAMLRDDDTSLQMLVKADNHEGDREDRGT
jgi:hypothetical protein